MQRPASLRSEGGRNGVDQVAGIAWTDRSKSVEYAPVPAKRSSTRSLGRIMAP